MKVKVVNVFLKAVFELAAFKFLSKMLIESKLKSFIRYWFVGSKKWKLKCFTSDISILLLGDAAFRVGRESWVRVVKSLSPGSNE